MKTVTVESLCSVVTSGGTPSRNRPDYYTPGVIPWVKTADLDDGAVQHYDEYISEIGLANSAAKLLPPRTILMAMYGATVGRLGWLVEEAACNQAACAMIANPGLCDWRWLFYAMLWTRKDLIGLASGAAQQNLNAGLIRASRVPAHNLTMQRAIAEVLGSLDEKIAGNERTIEAADDLMKSIFQAVAGGGQEVPLSSLARFVNGKAFTKDASGTGRVVIRIAELNSGIGMSTAYNDIDVAEDHLARPGDLLFAWSGSLTAARWFRPEAIVNQHIFKVIPNAGVPLWMVNQAVHAKLEEFKAIAADKATTMGHIQRRHLDEPVSVPAPDEIRRIDRLMTGLWETALAAEIETLKLVETRDELLPLLMSGKVRVREAEKVVEGAL